MLPSDLFFDKTQKKYLYNIMPIGNVPSVLEHGLLCYHRANRLPHTSIAMNEVQNRRENKIIPGGFNLHDYANLYFHYRNPMLYSRKKEAEDLCILSFRSEVLNIKDCVVSDRNAASPLARFFSPSAGISHLRFDLIYAEYWTHDDYYEQEEHKKIKCAEVLVPYFIPEAYLHSACVVCTASKQILLDSGFVKPIYVSHQAFFG